MLLTYNKYIKTVIPLLSLLSLIIFVSCSIQVSDDETTVEQIYEVPKTESTEPVSENDISFLPAETEESESLPLPAPLQEASETETQPIKEVPPEEFIQEPQEETQPETTLPTVPEETQPVIPPREPAELTIEALLDDFDYFAFTLRENYPFYGIANRKFGLDLQKQIDAARIAVQNLNTAGHYSQTLRGYADILAEYIVNPMRTMGHMIGLWAGSSSYNIQLALIKWDDTFETSWYPNLYADHLLEVFTSPTAIRYYGDVFENVDVNSYIQSNLLTPVADNVSFQILQPDSIAYMQIKTMNSANFGYDGELIAEFADTIGHFDHLIIDLRGNHGGYAGNFTEHIIAPLIDSPVSLQYYVFFMGGEHAVMYDNIYYRDLQWQIANGLVLHTDAPRFLAADMLPYLTDANMGDFARLIYGFKRELTVNPSEERWAFKGRVWILIDKGAYSAAEISAAIAKESGFATLVGDSTFGSFGGYTASFISLPNTGIIIRYDYGYVTDLQGRSLEEFGVTPHIFNRPGMDALATTLALIAEEK